MKVSNMTGRTGREVANQFIITGTEKYLVNGEKLERDVEIFQSYSSTIAKKYYHVDRMVVELDENYWDYSVTTGKYRNQFLNETKKETEKKIESGEYKLTNLN